MEITIGTENQNNEENNILSPNLHTGIGEKNKYDNLNGHFMKVGPLL